MPKMKKRYIFTIAIVVIFLPLLINELGLLLRPFKFQIISNENVWLSFYGNYFGGLLTLVGVFLTLSFMRKQTMEEKRLSVIPFLNFDINPFDNSNDKEIKYRTIFFNDFGKMAYIYLITKNIGLGNASNIKIIEIAGITNIYDSNLNLNCGDNEKFKLEIPEDMLLNFAEKTSFDIYFDDLLENNYKQTITFDLMICGKVDNPEFSYYINLENYTSPKLIKKKS